MRRFLICSALLLSTGSVEAQQASYTFFGQGCAQGEPHFNVIGVPGVIDTRALHHQKEPLRIAFKKLKRRCHHF